MLNKKNLFLLFIIFIIFCILGEIIVLFIIPTIQHNKLTQAQQQSSNVVLAQYLAGYYLPTIGDYGFTLVAILQQVKKNSDDSITGIIYLKTQKGLGQSLTQSINISPELTIVKRNDVNLTPISTHMKIVRIYGNALLQELMQNINSPIAFFFLQKPPKPNLPPDVIKSLGDLDCNNQFFAFLDSGGNLASCIPYTQQISIYEATPTL